MRRGFGFHDRHSPFRFNPATLFVGGAVQGAWYDPSDLTTMFQDSAGTTQVTAVEQPVGLILDKSKGLVLGSELVNLASLPTPTITNSGGSVGAWNASTRTMSNTATGTNPQFPRFAFNFGLVTNTIYRVQGLLTGNLSALESLRLATGGAANNITYSSTTGIFSADFRAANGNSLQFLMRGDLTAPQSLTIAELSIRQVTGNHAYQTVSASRPTLRIVSALSPYLSFDGSDDSLLTNSVDFSATNKMTVCAGLLKSSDVAQGVVAELSATIASNNGAFLLSAPNSAAANYNWSSKGTTQVDNTVTTYTAPNTAVLTGQADIAAPSNIIRVNGAQAGSVATTQGTGNFGNYPLYIGRRNNATLPFNGRLYGLIVLGAAASDWQVYVTEQWMASKTGLQF